MNESRYYRFFQQNYLIAAVILTVFLTACFLGNLAILFKYDVPLGVDGFYYIVQIENFLKTGSFYYPTNTPVVLYLAVGLSNLGIEPETAVKILSSLLYAVLILSVYLIISRAVGDKLPGFAGVLIVEASVLRVSWIIEFVNNLGGITFLFCGIYCFRRRSENKFWLAAGGFFIILAVFCHKSILPLILLLFLGYGIIYLLDKSSKKPFFLWLLIFVILTGVFYPLFLTLAPFNNFFPFLSENISVNPKFPLFVKGFFEEKFILTILSPIAFFVSLRKSEVNKNIALANGAISLLSLFVTLNPFLNHTEEIVTIPDRLALLMHIQIAFLLAFTMQLTALDKTSKMIITGVILVILLAGNAYSTKGINERFLAQRQNLTKNLEKFKETIPKESIIIAPHGYQFLLTAILDVPSQRLLPKENARIYWLIFGVPCDKVEKAAIVSVEGRTCTTIIENGDTKPMAIEDKKRLLSMNPHLERADNEIKDKLLPTQEAANNE